MRNNLDELIEELDAQYEAYNKERKKGLPLIADIKEF